MQKSEFAVIINPGSGSNDEEFVQKIRTGFEASERTFIFLETDPEKGAAPAIEKAIESGVHTIVVCGGDGTVMSAVNALGKAEADLKLAIVPGGTANLVARALEVPLNVEGALSVALDGDERRIDLGSSHDVLFALGLGLGLTEKLVSKASAEEKDRLGKWAYVKAMLEEVGARPTTFTYVLDEGEEQNTKGVAVVIANTGTLSGKIEFAPGAKMDDGQLDLVILHRLNVRDLFRLAGRALFGNLEQDRVMTCVAGKTIEIKSDPPLDMQIDGEVVELHPPLKVEVRPGALRVGVPSEEQKTSFAENVAEALNEAVTETVAKPVAENLMRANWQVLVPVAVAVTSVVLALAWKMSKRK